jgi:invasion protein IalB
MNLPHEHTLVRGRKVVLGIALVAAFCAASPGAVAQETEFPPGAVDEETGAFTVTVDTPEEADELCTAFQASTTAYEGEDTVIFATPNDTNADDVTCLRVEGTEDEVAEEAGIDNDDLDAAIPLGVAGGLVLLGIGWALVRDR